MSMFNNVYDSALASFSDWIQVDDNKSNWTIEDFSYKTGVVENLTKPHCWKCVSVNKCWFKNENGKKPEAFDYSDYSFKQIGKAKRGLYHPNCHCKEKAINVPKLNDINVIIDYKKINFFFKDKLNWFRNWGYTNNDEKEFINSFSNSIKESYRKGNYEKEKHTGAGYQINLFIDILGKNDKRGKVYKITSSCIIFPNGKLRLITLVGGKQK